MKLGIITDVHSNIQALNAVLNTFEKENIDKIICCGDMIGIGINPEETIQELIKRKDILIPVLGNHEQYLLKGLPKYVHDEKIELSNEEAENHKWNHKKLSKKSIEFLNKLDLSKTVDVEGKRIHIVHYPINEKGNYKKHIKEPNITQIKELFNYVDADIYLYGHTHTYCVNYEDNKWYINPGSLGCPLNTNIAKAGILEINNGTIKFNPINVEYNVKEIIDEIKKIKNPFYKGILKFFYGTNN